MKTSTEQALDRAIRSMERASNRKRRRVSTAPFVLGLGLTLGYLLLTKLVPRAWAALLPGGLLQAQRFPARSWPGLVLRLALWCHQHFATTMIVIGVVVFVAILLSRLSTLSRWLVWLLSVAVIGLDAGIIYVTLRTALEATANATGLG